MIPVPPRDSNPQRQPPREETQPEEAPYVLPHVRRPSEWVRGRLVVFALLGGLFVTLLLSCVLSTLTLALPRDSPLSRVSLFRIGVPGKQQAEPSRESGLPTFAALVLMYGASLVAPMILVFAIIGAADVIARTIGRASSRTAEAFLKGTKKREAAAARGNLTDEIVSDYFKKGHAGEPEPPENR
jgi:hypothetical protein